MEAHPLAIHYEKIWGDGFSPEEPDGLSAGDGDDDESDEVTDLANRLKEFDSKPNRLARSASTFTPPTIAKSVSSSLKRSLSETSGEC